MERSRMKIVRGAWWLSGGLVAGAIIGWLDLSATEVQGALLLVMLGAFAFGMSGVVAPWLGGIVIVLGMTGVHLVAWALGRADASGLGSIIAVVPAVIAAYGGRLTGMLVERAADSLPYGRATNNNEMATAGVPWYARRSASRSLLAVILCGCAIIGLPVVYQALLAARQPITWWVTAIWQIVTLMGWVILTPNVIRRRGETGAAPTIDSVATVAVQIIVLAAAHAIALVVLTRLLFIPLGDSGMISHVGHAFAAYLPLDVVTFLLLRTLAYVSDADRHLRESANRSAAAAASLSAELNASRLTALRAQLQPHFLFNAINAAVVLSSKGDACGAAALLTSLAELLRYVLSSGSGTVQLDQELQFTERYLEVERARFPDRLRFSIDVDSRLRDALVPHLLLQPLVENAVHHGIATKIAGGTIRVRAWAEDRSLNITVEDDGTGIGDESLRESWMPSDAEGGPGVGIANTRSRLSLMYGESATLAVTMRPGGGTICRVTFPLSSFHVSPSKVV